MKALILATIIIVRGMDNAPWIKDGNAEWTALDGTIAGAPDACRSGNDIVLVGRGTDNAAWTNRRSGTTWSGWTSLGGVISSDVAVVCTSDGGARIFARGEDRALWTRTVDPSGEWTSLDGVIESAPDASVAANGTIDVVARGSDSAVWHRGWTSSGWSEWRSLGGRTATAPSIARLSNDRAEIVIVDAEGTPHAGTLGATVTFQPLGGTLRGSATAVSAGDGRLTVLGRGTDNAVWRIAHDGTHWGGWESLGGEISSSPAALPDASVPVPTRLSGSGPAPRRGTYELEWMGFHVFRQTTDDMLNRDGWGDEVYFAPTVYRIEPDGRVVRSGNVHTGNFGENGQVRAGSGTERGGLVSGDSVPRDDDFTRGGIVTGPLGTPWRGELVEGAGGVVIFPTLWEWDNRNELLGQWFDSTVNLQRVIERGAQSLFSTMRAGAGRANFVRTGADLGAREMVRWPGAPGPIDYPIGVAPSLSPGMQYTPPAIVLTFEAAEHVISRPWPYDEVFRTAGERLTALIGEPGPNGHFVVRLDDNGDGFTGSYVLYFRLRKIS